ncbi:MAG: hypothetical protein M1827_007456 [Pycnora praestabilis]|nr:MAG: hypothetical protein M1827_007456 [Pycnora praestabilis]
MELSWMPPRWLKPALLEQWIIWIRSTVDNYVHPTSIGSIYIPASITNDWVSTAAAKFTAGEWVSRNDLITDWVYKHACASYPPSFPSILSAVINLRGRHPLLPTTYIASTTTFSLPFALDSRDLLNMSSSQLALLLHRALTPFIDPAYVARIAAFEIRRLKSRGRLLLFGNSENRFAVIRPWSNLDLARPSFGNGGDKTIALVVNDIADTFSSSVTIVDDGGGEWRVGGRLKREARGVMGEALEGEMRGLREKRFLSEGA